MATGPGAYAGAITLPAPSSEILNGGWFDYNDAATSTTPLSITGGAGFVLVPNDGAGPFTEKSFAPSGVTDVWNTATNRFDFSQLSNGDSVEVRLDVDVITTAPNQTVNVVLTLDYGGAGEYDITFIIASFKDAGTHNLNRYNLVYIGSDAYRLGEAVFRISSDDDATAVVNGWAVNVTKRG